ncbi:MAG: hypothetical protein ABIJ30_06465 [bacterium]
MEKGKGRREKGEGRREKGEGRREKGEGQGQALQLHCDRLLCVGIFVAAT